VRRLEASSQLLAPWDQESRVATEISVLVTCSFVVNIC
jgi:hypothetical protein